MADIEGTVVPPTLDKLADGQGTEGPPSESGAGNGHLQEAGPVQGPASTQAGQSEAAGTPNLSQQNPSPAPRKSRWSTEKVADVTPGAGDGSGQKSSRWAAADGAPPARTSRWSADPQQQQPPSDLILKILANVGGLVPKKTRWGVDPTQAEAVKRGLSTAMQKRADQLNNMLEMNELEIAEEGRSPSPEPMYDLAGQRINSREKRTRESMEAEWKETVAEIVKLDPQYRPPSSWKPPLYEHKLFIPVKKYPGFNFIGFILGPRGNSRRRMEQESGARIVIRGRGSVKDGRATRMVDHTEEDLHVHVQADSMEKVDKAVEIIEPLLHPGQDTAEKQMQRQLRELAEINGLVRDFDFGCSICGEKGHRDWQCTQRAQGGGMAAGLQVVCTICGETSHPATDCPRKFGMPEGQPPGVSIEKEYLSFLEELGEGGASVPGLDEARKSAVEQAQRQLSRPPRPPFRAGLGFGGRGEGFPQNGPPPPFNVPFRPPMVPATPPPPSEEEEWLRSYEEEQRKHRPSSAGAPGTPWGAPAPPQETTTGPGPVYVPGEEFFPPAAGPTSSTGVDWRGTPQGTFPPYPGGPPQQLGWPPSGPSLYDGPSPHAYAPPQHPPWGAPPSGGYQPAPYESAPYLTPGPGYGYTDPAATWHNAQHNQDPMQADAPVPPPLESGPPLPQEPDVAVPGQDPVQPPPPGQPAPPAEWNVAFNAYP